MFLFISPRRASLMQKWNVLECEVSHHVHKRLPWDCAGSFVDDTYCTDRPARERRNRVQIIGILFVDLGQYPIQLVSWCPVLARSVSHTQNPGIGGIPHLRPLRGFRHTIILVSVFLRSCQPEHT